ncbi:hypothetical protein NDU88_003561 [Pleurodeles waltl]|uniref:Uncharacterized protein n=1 Tax=Pleurodeles waltl TaxID=8319 RepID=A0AAV7UEJ2_PLEWA|nr:hypothetical protein NDU88_003561 [Pleurodeles waltl]
MQTLTTRLGRAAQGYRSSGSPGLIIGGAVGIPHAVLRYCQPASESHPADTLSAQPRGKGLAADLTVS